jgi:hypothetical protein
MLSIRSVEFEKPGCEVIDQSESSITWAASARPEIISLHYFAKEPDIPCPLSDLKGLRDGYRKGISQAGGGLVAADVITVKDLPCLQTIFKLLQQPSGMMYLGSLTFPFADASFVIKIQCAEPGTSGLREAIIINELMGKGEVVIDPETLSMKGWAQDPYDPDFEGPALRNKSEDEKYDAQFPDHPLTRTRLLLTQVKDSLKFDSDVQNAKPFTG